MLNNINNATSSALYCEVEKKQRLINMCSSAIRLSGRLGHNMCAGGIRIHSLSDNSTSVRSKYESKLITYRFMASGRNHFVAKDDTVA